MLLAFIGAAGGMAAEPGFVDPLDSPAIKTPRAAASQLIAVAHAGKRLVAVGQFGHVLISDDMGKTWSQSDVPLSSDLVAVDFPTPAKGWATGHYGVILHSEDGGLHWTKQIDGRDAAKLIFNYYQERVAAGDAAMNRYLEDAKFNFRFGPTLPFLDIWFQDGQTGYAVGSFGLIMATTDGGAHWVPWMDRTENPRGLHLDAVRGIDGEIYIASERGTVFLYDKGKFVPSETGYRGSLFGIAGGKGYVVAFGLRGNVYKSQDRGKTWRKIETGTEANINAGTVLDDGRLILATQGGAVLVSKDEGESFTKMPASNMNMIADIAPAGADSVAIVGMSGVSVVPIK